MYEIYDKNFIWDKNSREYCTKYNVPSTKYKETRDKKQEFRLISFR